MLGPLKLYWKIIGINEHISSTSYFYFYFFLIFNEFLALEICVWDIVKIKLSVYDYTSVIL